MNISTEEGYEQTKPTRKLLGRVDHAGCSIEVYTDPKLQKYLIEMKDKDGVVRVQWGDFSV